MARYFLDIVNGGGRTLDEEGVEAADLDEARDVAIAGIRSMLCDEIGRGAIDLGGRIEIYDSARARVATVAFGEAVELRLPA